MVKGALVIRGVDLRCECRVLGAGTEGYARPGVSSLGYVERSDLPALYGAAGATLYVSRYEGFGLPPLEAAACGGAVLTTRVGALAEIFDEPCLAKRSRADFVDALRALTNDADADAANRASARASIAHLSWKGTAIATATAYALFGVRC